MEGLPDIPVWLLAVFAVLVKFIVDLINGDWRKPMAWVSVGVGQVLCWGFAVDAFALAHLTPVASPLGYILTGLMVAAGASSVVHPLSKAANGIAELLKPTEGEK